jgi:hypothetical protein
MSRTVLAAAFATEVAVATAFVAVAIADACLATRNCVGIESTRIPPAKN